MPPYDFPETLRIGTVIRKWMRGARLSAAEEQIVETAQVATVARALQVRQ